MLYLLDMAFFYALTPLEGFGALIIFIHMDIVPATKKDLHAIISLVNSAYRGETAKKGWTHEADLIKGDLRIDEKMLTKLFDNPDSVILKAIDQSGEIVGCVYLEKKDITLYLGMLSVSPYKQASGIGKLLLKAADDYAKEKKCNTIEMTVISVRKELINWYERNGYVNTRKVKPFAEDGRFGIPAKPIEFVVLEKIL